MNKGEERLVTSERREIYISRSFFLFHVCNSVREKKSDFKKNLRNNNTNFLFGNFLRFLPMKKYSLSEIGIR